MLLAFLKGIGIIKFTTPIPSEKKFKSLLQPHAHSVNDYQYNIVALRHSLALQLPHFFSKSAATYRHNITQQYITYRVM